ncbi:hypothetical protein ACHAXT_009553 [Thalassiosira profunda]
MMDAKADEIFHYTGGRAPRDVRRVRVDPSVTRLPTRAFCNCVDLIGVRLPATLEEIGDWAFAGCVALEHIDLPPSLRIIGERAFYRSFGEEEEPEFDEDFDDIMVDEAPEQPWERMGFAKAPPLPIRLPDSVQTIGRLPFSENLFPTFRIPPLVVGPSLDMISVCRNLFSVEVPEDAPLHMSSLVMTYSLRNVVIPRDTRVVDDFMWMWCTSLARGIWPSKGRFQYDSCLDDAQKETLLRVLQHRFDELPLHKMLYYQSYQPVTAEQIRITKGDGRCCLGMTALHILACSTVQHLPLYHAVVGGHPQSLCMADNWGDVPLFYAIWGDAPSEIVHYLAKSTSGLYPNYQLDWSEMLKTLAWSHAPLKTMQSLLRVKEEYFPEQSINWGTLDEATWQFEEGTVLGDLLEAGPDFMMDEAPRLDALCFLVKRSIAGRLDSIPLVWKNGIEADIDRFSSKFGGNAENHGNGHRRDFVPVILDKLCKMEKELCELKESAAALELALWSARIDTVEGVPGSDTRKQCRVTCGAEVVVPNVMSYILEYRSIGPRCDYWQEEEE